MIYYTITYKISVTNYGNSVTHIKFSCKNMYFDQFGLNVLAI